jgi:hypothetical protein
VRGSPHSARRTASRQYVYAPNEEGGRNVGWRTPARHEDRAALAAFVGRCHADGMELWTGLRPLGFDHTDSADLELVVARLRADLELGADRVLLWRMTYQRMRSARRARPSGSGSRTRAWWSMSSTGSASHRVGSSSVRPPEPRPEDLRAAVQRVRGLRNRLLRSDLEPFLPAD